jgi:hypothetical protein
MPAPAEHDLATAIAREKVPPDHGLGVVTRSGPQQAALPTLLKFLEHMCGKRWRGSDEDVTTATLLNMLHRQFTESDKRSSIAFVNEEMNRRMNLLDAKYLFAGVDQLIEQVRSAVSKKP